MGEGVRQILSEEEIWKYIEDNLSEIAVKLIHKCCEKYQVKPFVGQLYLNGLTLEQLKKESEPRDPNSEFIGLRYPERQYIVNNLPTGRYAVIHCDGRNWPVVGDNWGPAEKYIGWIDWNQDEKTAAVDLRMVCSEDDFLVSQVECFEPEKIENNDKLDFLEDQIIIAIPIQARLEIVGPNAINYETDRTLKYILSEFISDEINDVKREIEHVHEDIKFKSDDE